MAFFKLGKNLQVILIASGLAVTPAGCKTPGEKPPVEPPGDEPTSPGKCKALDVSGVEVRVTRSTKNRSTLELELKGSIPEKTELEEALSGEGIEVIRSSVSSEGVLKVEIAHGELAPGDVGTLIVDVKTVCGKYKAVYRDRVYICKQAGGLKILESAAQTCAAPPDAATAPDTPVIVDPVPYPVDPPPPPPDPVPQPTDPVPYPGDPPPPPPDPVPPPDYFIVDCVPDAMGPEAQVSQDIHSGHAADVFQPRIYESVVEGGFALRIVDRLGHDPGDLDIRWSCSGGTLSSETGQVVRWLPPGDGQVQSVMAVIRKAGLVHIETWKYVPARHGE